MTDRKIWKMNFYNYNKAFNMLSCLFLFLYEIHSDEPDIVVSKNNKVLWIVICDRCNETDNIWMNKAEDLSDWLN